MQVSDLYCAMKGGLELLMLLLAQASGLGNVLLPRRAAHYLSLRCFHGDDADRFHGPVAGACEDNRHDPQFTTAESEAVWTAGQEPDWVVGHNVLIRRDHDQLDIVSSLRFASYRGSRPTWSVRRCCTAWPLATRAL